MVRVLILYYSRGGNVEALAKVVAQGVEKVEGATAELKRVDYATVEDLISCNAVAFGSPNYFGYMAGLLKDFFDRAWSVREKAAGKPAAIHMRRQFKRLSTVKHRKDFPSFQNGEDCWRRCLGAQGERITV